MKKITFLSLIASAALAGCVTTSDESTSLTDIDFNDLTCEQIETTFTEYKENIDSSDTYTGLVGIVSSEAETSANTAKAQAMDMYNQAKEKAQPVIEFKNCDINI